MPQKARKSTPAKKAPPKRPSRKPGAVEGRRLADQHIKLYKQMRKWADELAGPYIGETLAQEMGLEWPIEVRPRPRMARMGNSIVRAVSIELP